MGLSLILHPRHAGQPTSDWWRRPASLRLWRGRPVGGREARLRLKDPAKQRKWQ